MGSSELKYIKRKKTYTNNDIKVNQLIFSIIVSCLILLPLAFFILKSTTKLNPEAYLTILTGYILGGVLLVVGAHLLLFSIKDLWTNRKYLLADRSELPYWRQDYDWPKKVLRSDKVLFLRKRLFLIMLFSLLSIGSFGLLFYPAKEQEVPLLLYLLVVAFAFGILLNLSVLFKELHFFLLYGNSKLEPAAMPILIGEEVKATFINRRVCERIDQLDFSLKLIQEEYKLSKKKEEVKYWVLYECDYSFPTQRDHCEISFPIPNDLPESFLFGLSPLYWVLDVSGENKYAKDFNCTFLLPIYE